jgi:hypothetical protein
MAVGDIVGVKEPGTQSWIVSGWFTPDYRWRAESLAGQLEVAGAPYHLFATQKIGAWGSETRRKPEFLRNACDLYQGKAVVLMDVDNIVLGPLDGIDDFAADVSFTLGVKIRRGELRCMFGSQTVIVRPTCGGRRFVEAWSNECRKHDGTQEVDEFALSVVMASNANEWTWTNLNPRYRGGEIEVAATEAVIAHKSAHKEASTFMQLRARAQAVRRRLLGSGTRVVQAQRSSQS